PTYGPTRRRHTVGLTDDVACEEERMGVRVARQHAAGEGGGTNDCCVRDGQRPGVKDAVRRRWRCAVGGEVNGRARSFAREREGKISVVESALMTEARRIGATGKLCGVVCAGCRS